MVVGGVGQWAAVCSAIMGHVWLHTSTHIVGEASRCFSRGMVCQRASLVVRFPGGALMQHRGGSSVCASERL